MIYMFNVIISILCILSIFFYNYYTRGIIKNYFKNHTIFFLLKLLFISMFICFFIYNFSISNYKIFIISGVLNFTFFHVLEGFVIQKNLFKNEIEN